MENGTPSKQPAFFIGNAQYLDGQLITGQIYPFIEDVNKTLLPHFAGSPYEEMFVGNFVDVVNNFNLNKWNPTYWNPKHLQSADQNFTIYCTLGWIIHCCEVLLEQPNMSREIKYSLTLYMDMHLPLMIHMEDVNEYSNDYLLTDTGSGAPIKTYSPHISKVYHQGKLPDVLHYIVNCSFFSDNRIKSNPIVHLLSKALPQRCTIRNLREIISNYCRQYNDVYDFIVGCLKCSLLGLYKSCIVRPNYQLRMKIMRKINNSNKSVILQWMMKDHQQLLFYIIKEFLVFGVHQIPSIYEEINQRYYWSKFEKCVMGAMDVVRKFENQGHDIFQFPNVESKLISINKQQIHHLYRPKRHTFASTFVSECDKHDDNKSYDFITKHSKKEDVKLMYQLAIRTPMNVDLPFEWLTYFNVGKQNIKKVMTIQETYNQEGSKTNLKQFINSLQRREFETIRDFCKMFERKKNIRYFLLPSHIYKQQYRALKRKYGISGELPKDIGKTYVCLECKQFKGFTNYINNKGKRINLYAYGHSKVLVEDDNMKLYCGKRCDKVDAKKRHNNMQEYSSFIEMDDEAKRKLTELRVKKRDAKEKRKDIKNNICADTELCSVNLLGVLLQFYDTMYTICPICANFMVFDSKYFTKDGFYCGCCIEYGKLYTTINCEWCKVSRGNETWTPILVKEGETKKNIYLCGTCYKPWIRNSEGVLELDTIKRGLMNKWKRLQHPSS